MENTFCVDPIISHRAFYIRIIKFEDRTICVLDLILILAVNDFYSLSSAWQVFRIANLYPVSCFRRPNEALLSINCFQKDLGDPNPLVRAWALRAMAGIRLLVIAPIVLVAVEKCARDPSVYVRKCAANALPKLHDLRIEENTPALEEVWSFDLLLSL